MLKIHDIKPTVEIPDYSIYLYYGLIIITTLITLLVCYFVYKFFTKNKDKTREVYIQRIKSIEFKDIKKDAYTISKYGSLITLNERQISLYEDLNNSLEQFKYKKIVPNKLTPEIKTKYEIFMESLDV